MKVIFLDHDGVICLAQQWGSREKKRKLWLKDNPREKMISDLPVTFRFDNFDKEAIKILNEILVQTGAEIVVSSDWKLHASLEEMRELYEFSGIEKLPLDFTPRLKDFDPETAGLFSWKGWLERARVLEINEWLKNNPTVSQWVAVDDLSLGSFQMTGGLENFVHTPRSLEGVKQTGVKQKILSYFENFDQ